MAEEDQLFTALETRGGRRFLEGELPKGPLINMK